MILSSSFEIVEVAGEYMAIPIGEQSFNGIVALNEASAFLLGKLSQSKSEEELVSCLIEEYLVDKDIAECDVGVFVRKATEIGLIKEA